MTKSTQAVMIYRDFKTLKRAERYQNRLYNRYDIVELIGFPRFRETGTYIWKAAKAKD